MMAKVSERNEVEPEQVALSMTRPSDFLAERGSKEVSTSVYNPNRGRLNPRELYAILNLV